MLALTIALTILASGVTRPFVKDAEPQSAQWIADIVEHGNWLLPHDYYHMVMRKPPLFYWLSAVVVKASGEPVDEVNARLVSLIAAALLAVEVLAWSTVRLGPSGGWLAFGFLLGMYGFASRATTALTDMLMSLLLFSVCIVALPLVRNRHEPGSEASVFGRSISAGVLLGLGLLTKGPVVIVLFAFALCLYLLMLRSNPLSVLRQRWPWIMLLISLAIAAVWYGPALLAGGDSQLTEIFLSENFGHLVPATAGGTGEAARPVYYIALRTLGASMPLCLLIPALVLGFSFGAFGRLRNDLLYQLALALAVLLLFSAASAKRDDYVLPALPPLATLFAALFTRTDHVDAADASATKMRWADRARDTTVVVTALVLSLTVLAVAILVRHGVGVGLAGDRLASGDASLAGIFADGVARPTPPFIVFVVLLTVAALLSMAGVVRRQPDLSGAGLALVCVATSTLWTGTVRPLEASTRSVASFAAEVSAKTRGARLYVAHADPEFAWYYHRAVPGLPRRIAISGPPAATTVYFVGRPGDLAIIAPAVQNRMRKVDESGVLGAGGSPALYLFGALK